MSVSTIQWVYERLYPQKPWWERWCFAWKCIGTEMRHGYGYAAWGADCDHRGAPASCVRCNEPVCMECHRRRDPHPSGEVKTVGGHWCEAPECVADELRAHGIVPRWRRP